MRTDLIKEELEAKKDEFKGKAIIDSIPIEFLGFQVFVSIGEDSNTAVRRVGPELLDERGESGCDGMTVSNLDLGMCVICLPVNAVIDTIVHEVVHTVGFIHQYHDLHYSFDNDESFAYMTGYLTNKIFDSIEKYKEEYPTKKVKKIKA